MKKTLVLCALLAFAAATACRVPPTRPGTTTTTGDPGTPTTLAPGAGDCDRACLKGALDQYLDALLAHDPARLPLAPGVRFTEDNTVKPVGEGLWRTATRARAFRQDLLDAATGVAGMHAVLEEATRPVLFVLRLRLVQHRITEIETVVTRNAAEGDNIFAADNLRAASPAMNLALPQRDSREAILRVADSYARGLKAGSFVQSDTPFSSDAYRLENGARMAGPGCVLGARCADIKTGFLRPNPNLSYRVLGVDEEAGIAWLALNFRSTGPGTSLFVIEMFKVYGGQIHAVEAFMKSMATGPVW
jgi:hypothetical protein